jgi:hypothetical protein
MTNMKRIDIVIIRVIVVIMITVDDSDRYLSRCMHYTLCLSQLH